MNDQAGDVRPTPTAALSALSADGQYRGSPGLVGIAPARGAFGTAQWPRPGRTGSGHCERIRGAIVRQIIVLGAALGCAVAQSGGTFAPAGMMTAARSGHAATLLLDGRVLLTGGSGASGEGLPSAEIYNPFSGAFTATGNMAVSRRLHTSTLLPDGRVLIVGGSGVGTPSAEIYDPASGSFSPTGNLIWPRSGHTAVVLSNGKVLVLGGYAPAEIYDPDSGVFTPTGPYRGSGECDSCASSTLLADGRVLFPEQIPAQLYDPSTGTFSLTGTMPYGYTATSLLMNGKVLFAGGEGAGRIAAADLYDPVTGAFSTTGAMGSSRVWHTLTLLPDGKVLAAGGETDGCSGNFCMFAGSVATAELYDPASGTFTQTGSMAQARETHTATLLNDGRVLLAGGVVYGGIGAFYGGTASAELYTPPVLVRAPRLFSSSGDGKGQGAVWHATTGQLASPASPAVAGEGLSMYTTNLTEGGVIPPQIFIGGKSAQILYFGAAPGYPGFKQVNVLVPDGIASRSTVSVRLSYLGRSSNEVTIAVQ